MLTLTRQMNEAIECSFESMTDEELLALRHQKIEMTIMDIRWIKVRLGITAPKVVQVHRKEVAEAIRRGNLSPVNLNGETDGKETNGNSG